MRQFLLLLTGIFTLVFAYPAISQSDSLALDQLRTESGVDPTRVNTRAGYSVIILEPQGAAGQIANRLTLNIGINQWSFNAKYEIITKTTGIPGDGFSSGAGDIKFTILNSFLQSGKHSLAFSGEFQIPMGKPGFGSQYFALTPALTYAYTIQPGLVLAIQPQYAFSLMKDPLAEALSILTIRSFLAKFTQSGYFFVLEPRPIFNFTNDTHDFILSPIMGKSLGGGFNLAALVEIPLTENLWDTKGLLYQLGFNRNF